MSKIVEETENAKQWVKSQIFDIEMSIVDLFKYGNLPDGTFDANMELLQQRQKLVDKLDLLDELQDYFTE